MPGRSVALVAGGADAGERPADQHGRLEVRIWFGDNPDQRDPGFQIYFLDDNAYDREEDKSFWVKGEIARGVPGEGRSADEAAHAHADRRSARHDRWTHPSAGDGSASRSRPRARSRCPSPSTAGSGTRRARMCGWCRVEQHRVRPDLPRGADRHALPRRAREAHARRMSRIAVVTSSPPMVEGGHMVIARSLVQALRDAGHAAEIVVTPQNRFGRQASAYLATWLTDVGSADGAPIDQVISLRFPSYAVRHPRHVCWLNHTMREYYDLWDRFSGGLGPAGLAKERVRRAAIHAADRYLLTRNVNRLFVQSRTIQQRLAMWPELRSDGAVSAGATAGVSLRRVRRLRVHGVAADRAQARRSAGAGARSARGRRDPRRHCRRGRRARSAAERSSARLGLADRVTLAGRITETQLLDHLARCRAVCFPPFEEDYGFVTVEAFACAQGRRHLPRQRRAGRARRGRRQRLRLRSDAAGAGAPRCAV